MNNKTRGKKICHIYPQMAIEKSLKDFQQYLITKTFVS